MCYWAQVSQTFIKRPIRQDDLMLDPEWLAKEPWPLTDRKVQGDSGKQYDAFRYGVWRSVLFYFPQRLTYEYFDTHRLVEINFQRDAEYSSVRQLKDLDLLVLVKGLNEPPNSYSPHILDYTLTLRRMEGRPTWVYRTVGAGAHPTPEPVAADSKRLTAVQNAQLM